MARGRRLLTAAAMLMSAAAAAGCVSMPSSGPVLPNQPAEDTGVSAQQYLQLSSEMPGAGWTPTQVVEGFLAANGSFAGGYQVARAYLTPQYKDEWNQDWSADVFKDGPAVKQVSKSSQTAVVTVSGSLQAKVNGIGTYAVPAPTNASSGTKQIAKITLTKASGQWRISEVKPSEAGPAPLLLSATDFQANYQQRDLYFFAPIQNYLVADPVYVPVAAVRAPDPEDLLTQLVKDLINPPADWLGNATKTTFPRGTKLVSPVQLVGNIAAVSLEGTEIGRSEATDEQIAAQLVWTLLGSTESQPVVQGVQLSINGKPWMPPDANANPVLQKATSRYSPPTGEAYKSTFYYLDGRGNVMRRAGPTGQAQEILAASAKGPHLNTIAVSPSGRYLAGLVNGTIYTAPIGGKLQSRDSGGFTSVSWDPSDNLWAVGPGGVVVVPAAGGAPVSVSVPEDNTITALRVAPDGVRVALVVGGTAIQFGAISWGSADKNAVPAIAPGAFSPFSVSGSGISDVTWYGPDNVIALSGSGPGSQATEYPVNGGTSTTVLHQPGMTNITTSWDNPLIAGTADGHLLYTESIGGGWVQLNFSGNSVVYPG